MAISSNSVIHFTNKFERIKGIFETKGFRLKYCLEETYIGNYNLLIATPMVSFCDIPMSEVKNHIGSYGSYGIGLYKTWAKKKGLNPVFYIEKESYSSAILKGSFERILKIHTTEDDDKILKYGFIRLFQFFKNYEGHLKHGIIDNENYRFYNEREWRYIPTKEDLKKNPTILTKKKYIQDKEKYNNNLSEIILQFEVDDVSYIIVDNEDEIPDLLNILQFSFEDKCTAKQLKILNTKIITKNQIFNDF